MSSLLPANLVRVKDFMTQKVFDASSGRWELDEEASGADLADMQTRAQIERAEPARAEPVRDGEARYRVFLTTFVYYTPATEGTHDPATPDQTGPAG